MSVKLEAGQWYRTRGGEIVYCIWKRPVQTAFPFVIGSKNGDTFSRTEDGFFRHTKQSHHADIIEHLPDCTGFDWEPPPKIQLREGAWYERGDGKIVGPCKADPEQPNPYLYKWHVESWRYRDDGTNQLENHQWLIREVDPPKPPQPKYRPFKNRNEALSHCDGWWLDEVGAAFRVMRVESGGVTVYGCFMSFDVAFERLKRLDGSPFGVPDDQ